jgi:hypothetical protein
VQLIQVNLIVFVLDVNIQPVGLRCNHEFGLAWARTEETWLQIADLLHRVQLSGVLSIKVQFKNHIGFGKNYRIRFCTLGKFLEDVLHRNFLEHWHIFDHHFLMKNETIINMIFWAATNPLEYEQLILLLLIHNQVFSTNYCYPVLAR